MGVLYVSWRSANVKRPLPLMAPETSHSLKPCDTLPSSLSAAGPTWLTGGRTSSAPPPTA